MNKEKKITKVAIVTYNRIGEGNYPNGVIRGEGVEIYIAQNGHRSEWAADPENNEYTKAQTRKIASASVARQIDLSDMDKVFIYVGANGGEEAIRQTRNIPSEKISYVLCHCNYGTKRDMIQSIGNGKADIISSECGGRSTLDRIVERFLN